MIINGLFLAMGIPKPLSNNKESMDWKNLLSCNQLGKHFLCSAFISLNCGLEFIDGLVLYLTYCNIAQDMETFKLSNILQYRPKYSTFLSLLYGLKTSVDVFFKLTLNICTGSCPTVPSEILAF